MMQDRRAGHKIDAFGHEYIHHRVGADNNDGSRNASAIYFVTKER